MPPLLAVVSPFSLFLSLSGIAIVVAAPGPYRYLTPLNYHELQEYFSTCKYDFAHQPPTSDSFDSVDDDAEAKLDSDLVTGYPPLACSVRDPPAKGTFNAKKISRRPSATTNSFIVNGQAAAVGYFPAAVSIELGHEVLYGYSRFCGGVLVTWRHIITTSSCIKWQRDKSPVIKRIQVGGTCSGSSDEVTTVWHCNERQRMITIDFEYIYYTSVPLARSDTIYNDNIAIIQLKGNGLKGQLSSKLNYACLSPPYHQWPAMATVTGWGTTVCGTQRPNYGRNSNPLRYGNVNIRERLQLKLQRTFPDDCNVTGVFCSGPDFPSDYHQGRTTEEFDVGNGVYYADRFYKRHLLGLIDHQIHVNDAVKYQFPFSVHINLRDHYPELCFYLGLCFPGGRNVTQQEIWADPRMLKLDHEIAGPKRETKGQFGANDNNEVGVASMETDHTPSSN